MHYLGRLEHSRIVSTSSPIIELGDDFLTGDECDHLIKHARFHAVPSTVVNNDTGDRVESVTRQSYTAFFPPTVSPVCDISDKLNNLFGWEVSRHFENFQLTYYKKGGFYKTHLDGFPLKNPGSKVHLDKQGQRLVTILIYLNTPMEGGATSFPNLGISVIPVRGRILCFSNASMDNEGQFDVDINSAHKAEIVSEGEKFILTTWIREQAWDV